MSNPRTFQELMQKTREEIERKRRAGMNIYSSSRQPSIRPYAYVSTRAIQSAAPSSVAPTSVAPTTVAPTTVAPTTVAPTTVAPTTVAPTTVAPTSVAPTSVAPTSVATVAPTSVESREERQLRLARRQEEARLAMLRREMERASMIEEDPEELGKKYLKYKLKYLNLKKRLGL